MCGCLKRTLAERLAVGGNIIAVLWMDDGKLYKGFHGCLEWGYSAHAYFLAIYLCVSNWLTHLHPYDHVDEAGNNNNNNNITKTDCGDYYEGWICGNSSLEFPQR